MKSYPPLSGLVLWISFLLAAATTRPASSEIVLGNFSAANPIKIMAVGDSITDDCVFNGAWRLYLQPLLETNGFPFTFAGRQSSTAVGSFTKTLHEGYCGAVTAAPGVLTSPVHGYAGTNVYLQKILADALTNVTPDVVLVLAGANDIGRGRNPFQVATNDVPALLNLIFSNAPNANVVLAKITALQSAVTGSLNYGAYATNVPIYNAALQAVVNQRRSAGQNVFLADMFSVVDFNTMFNSDHLHPNTSGLQAIAGEWFTRIDALTIRTNRTIAQFVRGGDNWNYSDAGQDLGTNWMRLDYDDSGWSNGFARFGYGDFVAATRISYGAVSTNKYSTTYFRHSFVAPGDVVFTNLTLRLSQAHGSLVWLNGQELWRTNLPAGPITYTNLSTRVIPGYPEYIFSPLYLSATNLLPGTNLLALELHQFLPTTPILGFDLELSGNGQPPGPPILSITRAGENFVLTWPLVSGSSFTLYSTTNLATPAWSSANLLVQTNAGQLAVTQSAGAGAQFFRLQKP